MLGRLLILFILIPVVELILLIEIGRRVGALPTIGLIIFTGTLGAFLARRQGLKVWRQLQAELAQGRPPAATLVEGVLILVAAAVLMTPGVLTDAFGFFLLIPPCRRVVRKWLFAWLANSVKQGRASVFVRFPGSSRPSPPPGRGPIYDVDQDDIEYESEPEKDPRHLNEG